MPRLGSSGPPVDRVAQHSSVLVQVQEEPADATDENRSTDVAQEPSESTETSVGEGGQAGTPTAKHQAKERRLGFEVAASDLLSLINEQQVEHERCIRNLLDAHRQQFLEAMRMELGRCSQAGSDHYEATAPSDAVLGVKFHKAAIDHAPRFVSSAAMSGHSRPGLSKGHTQESSMAPTDSLSHSVISATESPRPTNTKRVGLNVEAEISEVSGVNFAQQTGSSRMKRYSMKSVQGQEEEVKAVLETQEAKMLEQSFNAAAGRLIQTVAFEYGVCLAVMLNAVSIGVHANWTMSNVGKDVHEPELFHAVDVGFAVIFLLELVLRVLGEGRHFLSQHNRNLVWNVMDVVLVVSAIIEEILTFFVVSLPNVSIMRMLRILRMVRVVRIFRVTRFFNDLRLIVMALMCAARSLFWVVVLLLFVMYIFAVFLMEVTASKTVGASPDDEIFEYIGSLEVTMYTLYKSVSGGLEWGPVADHLAKRGAILTVLYAVYIAFATLCILNVVTGIFVQNTSTIANNDQIELGLEHLERRRVWLNEVMDLFKLVDADGTGQIDWLSFKSLVTKPSVQACFLKLGIDLDCINTRGLFCLFDVDNDGAIELEEFAHGIMKLHGSARSLDLQMIGNDSKRMLQYLQMLMRRREA